MNEVDFTIVGPFSVRFPKLLAEVPDRYAETQQLAADMGELVGWKYESVVSSLARMLILGEHNNFKFDDKVIEPIPHEGVTILDPQAVLREGPSMGRSGKALSAFVEVHLPSTRYALSE